MGWYSWQHVLWGCHSFNACLSWSFCRLNLGYVVLLFQGLKMFIWGVEDLYPLFVILTLLCSQRKWKATFRTWSRFNFWKLICFICCALLKSLLSLSLSAYFLSLSISNGILTYNYIILLFCFPVCSLFYQEFCLLSYLSWRAENLKHDCLTVVSYNNLCSFFISRFLS